MRLPYEEVARSLRSLSGGRLRMLLDTLGYRGETPGQLDPGDCLVLWLAECMECDRLIYPDHQAMLLSELRGDIVQYGNILAKELERGASEQEVSVCLLSVANRAFASISGREGFLNLSRGGWVTGVRNYPRVQVVYNLAGVFITGQSCVNQVRPQT